MGLPSEKSLRTRHLQFSDTLRLSSWAKEARKESISSPSLLRVSSRSFSKNTAIPRSFSSRAVSSRVTVFRAKRLTDLVRIRSIFPARQSASSR